jgi:hypothetical protein
MESFMELRPSRTVKNPIGPGSLIRLIRGDASAPCYRNHIGEYFQVLYYSKQDGLDCIWLKGSDGEVSTTDHSDLANYEIVFRSKNRDYFASKSKIRDVSKSKIAKLTKRAMKVVAPGSIVKQVGFNSKKEIWREEVGATFTVGYYSPCDGLNQVWLAEKKGKFVKAIEQSDIGRYFKIVRAGKAANYCGPHVP